MKRIALVALLAAAGCGEVTQAEPGPRDRFYFPTGIGVSSGRLLVASSNFDLRYDDETGGSIVSVEHDAGDALRGGINIRSFAGEMAVADAATCGLPESLALVPVRGSNYLYRVSVAADGSLSCIDCEIPLGGTQFVDPFAVGVACGPGVSRAYVSYLRSSIGEAWITQVDLSQDPPALRHRTYGLGRVRDFAYEPARKRLWIVGSSLGIAAPLRWVDLLDGCTFDQDPSAGGCRSGTARAVGIPDGIELRSLAFAHATTSPRRVYLTARRYDPAVAATLGLSAPDLGGVLLVADLRDDGLGSVNLVLVRSIDIGRSVGKARVLPVRAGRRDVVAAFAADDGVLWLYDDETGDLAALGRDPVTGAPAVGRQAFGFAVDPVPLTVAGIPGATGRVYVGSFQEGFVTPFDVPLDVPWASEPPRAGTRITGGTP